MKSELEQARHDVALYLRGESLPPGRLRDAWRIIERHDPSTMQRFHAEMLGQMPVDCARWADHLAEFCEMSPRERLREMPGLVAHLFTCTACCNDFRDILKDRRWKPVSRSEEAADHQSPSRLKEMTTWFRVALDKGRGTLAWDHESELLFGDGITAVAVAMGPVTAVGGARDGDSIRRLEPPPAIRKQWHVTDDETGIVFRFCSRLKPGTDVTLLELAVVGADGVPLPLNEVMITVKKGAGQAVHAACPLDFFTHTPLEMEPGAWHLEIRHGVPPSDRRWLFHFDFASQADAEGPAAADNDECEDS